MNRKPTPKSKFTKLVRSQDKQQNFLHRIVVFSFVMQGLLIGIRGNLDILSGKPMLDVLQGMISQGIELIIKVQSMEGNRKKGDRKPPSHK